MTATTKPSVTVNTDGVVSSLQRASNRGGKNAVLDVGYSAPYAMYVHENLHSYHDNGQAKYLESVARNPIVIAKMQEAIRKALKNKRSLRDALIDAGNVLLKESLPLVPVDTGFLRDSHFVNVKEVD